jgi:transcription elongation factor GreA
MADESNSDSNNDSSDISLSDSIATYLQTVKPAERNSAAIELSKFARWYSGDRPLRRISPGDLERYQEQAAATGGDPARLTPLRQFFSDAHKRRLLAQPLAAHVRIRRKSSSNRVEGGAAFETVELTSTGHAQLTAELERLEQVEQPKARDEMQRAAADKDFRENAPYDAAKQHLAELTRRANEIRAILSPAVIVEERSSDRVRIGSTVVVRDLDESEDVTYTLVGPGEVDPRKGKISTQSPVGRALSDRGVGDVVEVETPAGVGRYEVLSISS